MNEGYGTYTKQWANDVGENWTNEIITFFEKEKNKIAKNVREFS